MGPAAAAAAAAAASDRLSRPIVSVVRARSHALRRVTRLSSAAADFAVRTDNHARRARAEFTRYARLSDEHHRREHTPSGNAVRIRFCTRACAVQAWEVEIITRSTVDG